MQQARYVVNATVGQRVGSLGVSYPKGQPGGNDVDAARASVCRTARRRKVTLGRAPLTTDDSVRPKKADDAPRPLPSRPGAKKEESGLLVNYIEEQLSSVHHS